MEYVISHWDQILTVGFAIIGLASAVVKITPTQKDDKFLAKVMKIVDALALNPKDKKDI